MPAVLYGMSNSTSTSDSATACTFLSAPLGGTVTATGARGGKGGGAAASTHGQRPVRSSRVQRRMGNQVRSRVTIASFTDRGSAIGA